MSQPTPGPWTDHPDDQGIAHVPTCAVWAGGIGVGQVVAYIPLQTLNGREGLPFDANARLIAQAPAMREVLGKLLRTLEATGQAAGFLPEAIELDPAVRVARAILKEIER